MGERGEEALPESDQLAWLFVWNHKQFDHTQYKKMSGKVALITGATGFLGRQVVKAFASHDWTAKGTGFSRADGVNILKVDLANGAEIEKVIEEVKCVHPRPTSYIFLSSFFFDVSQGF